MGVPTSTPKTMSGIPSWGAPVLSNKPMAIVLCGEESAYLPSSTMTDRWWCWRCIAMVGWSLWHLTYVVSLLSLPLCEWRGGGNSGRIFCKNVLVISCRLASLGEDSDPGEEVTGDMSLTNQSPIKLELAFSQQDEA